MLLLQKPYRRQTVLELGLLDRQRGDVTLRYRRRSGVWLAEREAEGTATVSPFVRLGWQHRDVVVEALPGMVGIQRQVNFPAYPPGVQAVVQHPVVGRMVEWPGHRQGLRPFLAPCGPGAGTRSRQRMMVESRFTTVPSTWAVAASKGCRAEVPVVASADVEPTQTPIDRGPYLPLLYAPHRYVEPP